MLEAMKELPRYKCHKEVWALKIAALDVVDTGAVITPEDAGYGPFSVPIQYIEKHNPEVGGYYVVYSDGYKSFSPADAFESGYTRIEHRTDMFAERMMRWFEYSHLPEHLQVISRPFFQLAVHIDQSVTPGPERTVAFRKLVEAKDAAVRASVHPGY